MSRRYLLTILMLLVAVITSAQPKRQLRGTVIDKANRHPIEYATIAIVGLNGMGSVSDSTGAFRISDIPAGIYKLQVSCVGYESVITPEYIFSTKDLNITVELSEMPHTLQEVTVTSSPFRRDITSPVGLRIIGLQEIEKSPGANRDISRIVQSYPGVAFSPSGYRNDLIVRGGSPSENRFYLDGVEIPNINHFSTQGASGGPAGIINADLIREVKFNSGSFPTNRGNALSSVLDFKLRDGNMDHNSLKATVGASEISLASNGHIGSKTSYLVSARQSYLQFLFDVLGLPFLPTYTDGQFKTKTRFNAKNELTLLGLVGIDDMRLNKNAKGESNKYLLGYLPKIEQETFTFGGVYKHYAGMNTQTVVLSHSYMNNRNTKYRDNDESSEDNLNLKIKSIEQNTQLRLENTTAYHNWNISAGVSADYSQYLNTTYQRLYYKNIQTFNYHTYLDMLRGGIYGSIAYTSNDERTTASVGVRTDICSYSSLMSNPIKQLSPRFAVSHDLTDQFTVSGSLGIYYQLPAYTSMGFMDNNETLVNKQNLKYMKATQGSLGISWHKDNIWELSIEAFYKKYSNIPLSLADSIPLACKGNDYGVVGNELLTSTASGRSYGVEILAKVYIAQKINVSSSLTLFKSEYRNDDHSSYIVSAWDNRFIFNLRGTYYLSRSWSMGMKLSCIGGNPYTPYDINKTSLVTAWDSQGKAFYDYSRYNAERLSAYGQADIRIDKTFYFKNWMLGVYLDVQNITGSKLKRQPVLMSTGTISNPNSPIAQQRYVMNTIEQNSGSVLPTIGLTLEF